MGSHAKLFLIAMGTVVALQATATRALPLMPVDEVIQTNLKCPMSVTIRGDDNLIPKKIKTITCDVMKLGPEPNDSCVEVTDTVWVWNVRDGRHEALTVSVGCVAAAEQYVSAARLPGER